MATAIETGDLSLLEALDGQNLPAMLKVTRDCKLRGQTVLKENQYITVLDRAFVHLLCGRDGNNESFRVSTEIVKEYLADIIDEFYPKTINDLKNMVTFTNYIQVKKAFSDDINNFNPFEMFTFCNFLDESEQNVVLMAHTGVKYCLDTSALLDSNYFMLVNVKETITVKALLNSFEPQVICFRDPGTGISLPLGNVRLEQITTYDTIFIVSVTNGGYELKYETFPVDKRIKVNLLHEQLPKHVEILGRYNSEKYQEKLMEVNFLMFYEIYAPRYYGYLNVENHLYRDLEEERLQPITSPVFKRPSNLDLSAGKSKAKSVYSSVRKGINKLLKHSPSKEDLKIPVTRTSNEDWKSSSLSNKNNNIYSSSEGFYKPLNQDNNLLNSIIQQEDKYGGQLNTDENIGLRTNSDPQKQVTISKNENPLYGMDTMTIEEIRKIKQRSNESLSIVQSKELTTSDLMRRKRTTPLHTQTFLSESEMFFNPETDDEILEKPFVEKSINETKYVSNDTVYRYKRTHSIPIRRNNCTEYKMSRSVSPVLNAHSPPKEGGDSGIDSPDIKKSVEQISKEFEQRAKKDEISKKEKKPKRNSMEISLPFNFEHKTKRSSDESLYMIPQKQRLDALRKEQTFDEMDGSNNFPDLTKMELISRSKSEPMLNELVINKKIHPIYEEIIYGHVKSSPGTSFFDSCQKRELQSMKEIKSYSIPNVAELLQKLNLQQHTKAFEKELINGNFLLNLSEKTLNEDLQLTKFQACKLYKYVHGWRSNTEDMQTPVQRMNDLDRNKWSVNDVVSQMKDINLARFSEFCKIEQIDGPLLLDLTLKKILPTLNEDGVKLTGVECERLRSYVCKELHYHVEDLPYLGKQ